MTQTLLKKLSQKKLILLKMNGFLSEVTLFKMENGIFTGKELESYKIKSNYNFFKIVV